MKKILFMILAFCSFFLISCGEENNPTTNTPTEAPTQAPTVVPTTNTPTEAPTQVPTVVPTTNTPTEVPTQAPTVEPTKVPTKPEITADPYTNVSVDTFYANYTEAESYMHAYYRTKHGLMSGSISDSERYYLPETCEAPKYKVTDAYYTYRPNGDYESYTINYLNGDSKVIYYGGAYVTLNEVCAYIQAFGQVPPNSNYAKGSTSSAISKWGKYGRVNIGTYSNNTVKYPYEPELPLKSKSGTVYSYTETDFGSTGGFSVTSYVSEYNTGSKISRGTCRIVFTNNAKDISERLVFYTWNHYNDFQEYLNYYDGFGVRFGNISNGGTYNTGSNPSPYVSVTNIALAELRKLLGKI